MSRPTVHVPTHQIPTGSAPREAHRGTRRPATVVDAGRVLHLTHEAFPRAERRSRPNGETLRLFPMHRVSDFDGYCK